MPFNFIPPDDLFPATNFNEVNLDWVLALATQLKETAESGGFDGAPGTPGTAANSIVFIDNTNTFSDITAALSDGNFPVLHYTISSNDLFLPLCSTNNGTYWFSTFYQGIFHLVNWNASNVKMFYNTEFATKNNAVLTGQPVVQNTPAPTDSSIRIANTQFVHTAVNTAINAALEEYTVSALSENLKQALLQIASKVAYIDANGATYYQALYDALYPPINIDYIEATFNQGANVIYDTDTLDSLKSYLTVVAYYDDSTSETLANDAYVLSGTLTAGTSTITATYAGASDTFTVTVTANVIESITAVFTPGDRIFCTVDTLDDLKPYLVVTGTYTDGTTESETTYTLSGTLTAGTSTITVSYDGETDTFTVSGVRTATKLFTNAVWHPFGSAGTVSTSESANGTLVASFNTTASTTNYSTGVGLDSSTPTSALETFGTIKGHRVRCYYESEWTSGNSETRLLAACYLGAIAYDGTRKKYCNFARIDNATQDGFGDVLVPASAGDFDTPWGGSGTVTVSDYFSIRHYWLTSVAGQAKITLTIYDLGAES